MVHREHTATLSTYLSDNLKIFTCLTPLDGEPILIFNKVQDASPPIQIKFSSDQQNRANFLNNNSKAAQQSRYKLLFSTAAKHYFATITLSPDELHSFRAFLPVTDKFCHFQFYVKNKQRAREHRNQSPKEQRIPRWKQWADKKVPQFRLEKTPPERELSLNEMPNELRFYVLEHPELEKVFNQPSFEENDSSTLCHKLEIKGHI